MKAGVRLTSNSVLRFGLELTSLAILGVYGWHAVGGEPQRLLLTIALPLVGAFAWGRFVAPRAPHFLSGAGRLGVEALFFGSAAVALLALGRPLLAVVWIGLTATNTALVHRWKQDVDAREATGVTGPRAA
jgi:hypothetical protein